MAWFFVQVWVLCLVAFLLGSAVTWFAFVRPLRRAGRPDDAGWPVLSATWPARPARPAVEVHAAPPPPPGQATDPALPALDVHGRERRVAAGRAATDALDRLGVGPAIPVQAAKPDQAPDIPTQPGPADSAGR
jgi:hypothetical protein